MRQSLVRCLDVLGLKDRARRLQTWLGAHGLIHWRPLVPADDFYECISKTLASVKSANGNTSFGDYLEFGVSRGTSTALVYRALEQQGLKDVHLFGFDSFEGMPTESEGQGWFPGQYHSTLRETQRYLRKEGVDLRRVTLTKGWFKETCNENTRSRYSIKKAGLVLIDCDIYSASKEALFFCEPYILDCAAIVFDDWGWSEKRGEVGQKEAFEEFLASFPSLRAESLAAYRPEARVFLIRRTSGPTTKKPIAPARS